MTGTQAYVIALLGIDGVGKTTQARRLAAWLSQQGIEAAYHRSEGGRSELDALARRHGRRDIGDLIGYENAGFAQAIVRWKSIRAAGELMGRTGTVVVMDRYIYCQYASAAMQRLPVALIRQIFSEFPPADIAFFLEIDPEVARARINERGIDSDSIELLRALDASYRALPEFKDFIPVNAERPPDLVQQYLRDHLARVVPGLGPQGLKVP